jgi:phosphoribosylamine-glycine ligase
MLDLRKKYKDEFLKVISPQQLATLIESEKEFKRLLLQQMKDRRAGGMNNRRGGGSMR